MAAVAAEVGGAAIGAADVAAGFDVAVAVVVGVAAGRTGAVDHVDAAVHSAVFDVVRVGNTPSLALHVDAVERPIRVRLKKVKPILNHFPFHSYCDYDFDAGYRDSHWSR